MSNPKKLPFFSQTSGNSSYFQTPPTLRSRGKILSAALFLLLFITGSSALFANKQILKPTSYDQYHYDSCHQAKIEAEVDPNTCCITLSIEFPDRNPHFGCHTDSSYANSNHHTSAKVTISSNNITTTDTVYENIEFKVTLCPLPSQTEYYFEVSLMPIRNNPIVWTMYCEVPISFRYKVDANCNLIKCADTYKICCEGTDLADTIIGNPCDDIEPMCPEVLKLTDTCCKGCENEYEITGSSCETKPPCETCIPFPDPVSPCDSGQCTKSGGIMVHFSIFSPFSYPVTPTFIEQFVSLISSKGGTACCNIPEDWDTFGYLMPCDTLPDLRQAGVDACIPDVSVAQNIIKEWTSKGKSPSSNLDFPEGDFDDGNNNIIGGGCGSSDINEHPDAFGINIGYIWEAAPGRCQCLGK